MEHVLTDDEISRICMMMRIIDLFHKNLDKIEKIPEMKKEYNNLSSAVNEIMRNLTDDQRDKVLKIHKKQMHELHSND
jgi:hypothetical protein